MPENSNKSISKQIIILAIPIIFSNLSRVVMGLADMAMVSRLGATALAATGMGSLLLWVCLSMGIGVRTAVQTVSSRRLGQKRYSECGNALHNGIILAVCIAIPLTIIGTIYAAEIASLFLEDLAVILFCTDYLIIGYFSIIFVVVGFAFQGFYAGIEYMRVHMVVTITSNILNIYLNAGFIYGSNHITQYFTDMGYPWMANIWNWLPFPALAVKGAALATLLASIFMVLHYTYFLFKKEVKIFKPHYVKFIFSSIVQQVKLGYPISISEVVLMIGFSVFYKIIGIIGITELATSNVILNIAHASFMPAVGVGMACATLIGKFLGEKSHEKADNVIYEGIKWSLLIMGSMGFIFIAIPHWIVPIFSTDPEIIRMGIPCLQIIGVLQYFDAVGITLFFVLTGAGDTRFPAIADMVIVWFVFLPISYYLGIVIEMGIIGAWLGFAAWIIPLAAVMALKVRTGTWKEIKV